MSRCLTVELTGATARPSSLAESRLMRKSLPVAPVQRFVGRRPSNEELMERPKNLDSVFHSLWFGDELVAHLIEAYKVKGATLFQHSSALSPQCRLRGLDEEPWYGKSYHCCMCANTHISGERGAIDVLHLASIRLCLSVSWSTIRKDFERALPN